MKKVITSLLVAGLSFVSTSSSEAADVSQYVQFITPITTQTIEMPKTWNSKDVEFLVTGMNPNKDVSTIYFELYDATGDKVDSEWMYFFDEPSKTEKKSLHIWSFTNKLPLTMKVIVKFNDSSAKFSIEQIYQLNVIPNQAEIIEKAAAEAQKAAELAKAKAEQEAQEKRLAAESAAANAKLQALIVKTFSGTKCSKLNSTMIKAIFDVSAKFKCVKSGSKLVWKQA